MRGDFYQVVLIASGILVTALLGVFLYREIYPEYKIYQNDYIEIEKFRSTLTHEEPPLYKTGIKQIVIEKENKGPAVIDRCITCHVALQIPYFSPTKLAQDNKGNFIKDSNGQYIVVKNEEYIWGKLDDAIAELKNEKTIEELKKQKNFDEIQRRLKQAQSYEDLKNAKVGDQHYDVTKVLAMHPLIGQETRPFEFHPIEEYGCVSCHSGNGRGLVTDKAHGPVFDGQYEMEDLGHNKIFLEADPDNDPRFSKIFNHKPGAKLLFQTEPILIGDLIQARCVQCHQPSSKENSLSLISETKKHDPLSNVDLLTTSYQRGEELYVSQACYACHRISGLSRGGVGPELTHAGDLYPWYMKRKMMWPKGDLPTSTMPNMRLDHVELEDLMTFLLAQKGSNKAISEMDYRVGLRKWEGGEKQEIEKPVSPSKIYDTKFSMTVFATEGCAACHRLQGFDSNVGFAVEKETHNFEQLYQEQQWFKSLFPEVVHIHIYDEELPGSRIVELIEKNSREIDEKIVSNVRENGIIEEIESKFPDTITSLYTPFRFAYRAKDNYYKNLIVQENDQDKINAIKKEWDAWHNRVHRVLMIYIQTYGLGRLIGPHLNWTGIFRSDEWMMEHFKNPSGHVPRSIMPVFPFDETKFYALTYLLNQLSIQNRNQVREIWNKNGFSPREAFEIHCSQCHGVGRFGNGVVAEELYPIPKNLLNAEFLRNLTKEKAIYSIAHGVHGTPMPPWGEVASDKPEQIRKESQGIPVLTESEIEYLVDWLYTSLPGGEVIPESTIPPKWNYTPENVIQELKNEKEKLKSSSSLSWLKAKEFHFASLNFLTFADKKESIETVEDIFNVIPVPSDSGPNSYYIKEKYYTPYNIEAGKAFFLVNCAYCHGSEADGSGLRSGVMQEAKPRMLTNLDWIRSRDDLRLLRSIKFGIPGTAMTPWGDFTNSLQRLQLVMYIRSLSQEKDQRQSLTEAIYDTYETALIEIENARIAGTKKIEILETKENLLKEQIRDLEQRNDSSQEKTILNFYEERLNLSKEIKKLRLKDDVLISLKELLRQEKDLLTNLGISLIAKNINDQAIQSYLNIININENRYSVENDDLKMTKNPNKKELVHQNTKKIIDEFNGKIVNLENEKKLLKGKIISAQVRENLQENQAMMDGWINLRDKTISSLKEASLLEKAQEELYEKQKN